MKALAASCAQGKVTCQGVEIAPVTILSEGVGSSTGFLFIDESSAFYVAKTSPDLNTTLEKLIAALNQVVTGLNATSSSTVSGIPLSGAAAIAAAATAVQIQVTALETLKGALK